MSKVLDRMLHYITFGHFGWRKVQVRCGDVHVVPISDLRKHKKSRRCWCDPNFENKYNDPTDMENHEKIVVIHEALDGRE